MALRRKGAPLKVLMFLFTGVVLIWINVWYVRSVYRTFFSWDMPEVVAPFQFVGREDPKGDTGRAMAEMLVSRLDSLQREIVRAEEALTELPPMPASSVITYPGTIRIVDRPGQITLQTRVLDVPEIQVKVSGVEFSNLLAWTYRNIAEGRTIRVSIFYQEGDQKSDKKVTVATGLETPGVGDIWIPNIPANDMTIVEEVASDIIRQLQIREGRLPEAAALDRKEYAQLVDCLKETANLNRKVRLGYIPPFSQYTQIVNRLEPLIELTPRWRTLVNLAAVVAENSRDLAKALALYERDARPDRSEAGSGRLRAD